MRHEILKTWDIFFISKHYFMLFYNFILDLSVEFLAVRDTLCLIMFSNKLLSLFCSKQTCILVKSAVLRTTNRFLYFSLLVTNYVTSEGSWLH